MQASLVFLISFLVSQVVSYEFFLTYRRIGRLEGNRNDLIFHCHVTGNYSSQDFSYWINKTEQVDILNGIPSKYAAVRVSEGAVFFNIQPQYEGTFYCGEMDGEKSNGVGPLIAIPDSSKKPAIVVYGNRTNTTLVCPIKLGALIQSYSVTWRGPNKYDSVRDNNSHPLTILGTIRYNEYYACRVTVTNPIDGQMFKGDRYFTVIPCGSCSAILIYNIFIIAFNVIIIIPLNCYLHCNGDLRCKCKCRHKETKRKVVHSNTSAIHIDMEPIMNDYKDLHIEMDGNIGNGAFGSVFRATYKESPCAVKLLTHHAQEMATGGAMKSTRRIQKSALECFQKECTYLKTLVHRNIVRHLATVIEPNSKLPMLVMELMDCSLKQYLEDRQDNRLSFLCQISLCFDISKILHVKNIIHRDLCDDNVLLAVKGDTPIAKIADFGMSRILPKDYMNHTLTGLAHRQVYLPSEARVDPYDYCNNHTLDIYSFGVLATQIVQVKPGIKRKEDLLATLKNIPNTHFLKKIIHHSLSEDRKSRPQASDIVRYIKPYKLAVHV